MSVGVAYLAVDWCDREDDPRAGAGDGCWSRSSASRPAWRWRGPARAWGSSSGSETSASSSARCEPTYRVGRWVVETPPGDGPADRPGPSGLLHPARLHDGAGPSPPDRAGRARRVGRRDRRRRLKQDGFTHLMLCPPVPRDGRRIRPDPRPAAGALAGRPRRRLSRGPDRRRRSGPPLLRSTSCRRDRPARMRPSERHAMNRRSIPPSTSCEPTVQKGRHREIGNWLARRVGPAVGRLRDLAGGPARALGPPGDAGRAGREPRRRRRPIGIGDRAGLRRSASAWRTWPSGSITSTARSLAGAGRPAWTASISTT